jgi:DNA-binding helix-turn-helix protein
MNYNEQIKKLREENMLSQREFCQKIDNFVEPWALSYIETQRKKVSPELIERIEKTFKFKFRGEEAGNEMKYSNDDDYKEKEEIVQKIESLRNKFGMTLKDFETETGIPSGTINRVKNGIHRMKIEHLKKIAEYFKIDYKWLMGLSNESEFSDISNFNVNKESNLADKNSSIIKTEAKENSNIKIEIENYLNGLGLSSEKLLKLSRNETMQKNFSDEEIIINYFKSPDNSVEKKKEMLEKITKIFYTL